MASAIAASLFHPSEVAALLQMKLQPAPEAQESGRSKDESYLECYRFLNLTSRSFARVIQELHPQLRHAVCLFYLVLRGLDTIEDDMTIAFPEKRALLLDFHNSITKPGWTFDGNSPEEKDRILLVEFHHVISELEKLKPEFVDVIKDITRRMGEGMAEFMDPMRTVVTLDDYNLYTHYVAGLVGIGLNSLFVHSGLESHPKLVLKTEKRIGKRVETFENSHLPNRMGLFLQKINIIKDAMGDLKAGRVFWPEEIWKQYVPEAHHKEGLAFLSRPENLDRAMAVLNHLCADALELVPDCLEYLSLLKEPSVFRFAAIPQLMFTSPNPQKIRRGLAAKLMLQSCQDIESLKRTYQTYVYTLHATNHAAVAAENPHDKSFVKAAVALGAIQRWINIHTMMNCAAGASVQDATAAALEISNQQRRTFLDVFIIVVLVAVYAWVAGYN